MAQTIVGDMKTAEVVTGVKTGLQQAGISGVRADMVTKIAEDIYQAFYKSALWGMGEDEEAAIVAINSLLSVAEARACATVYKVTYKKSLYQDIQRFINSWDTRNNELKANLVEAMKGV